MTQYLPPSCRFKQFTEGTSTLDRPAAGAPIVSSSTSDAVSRVFRSNQLWVWQHLAFAPNAAKTTLIARTPQAVVDAVKIARKIDPSVGVSVRRDLPGGRARLSALRAAGISVREMF